MNIFLPIFTAGLLSTLFYNASLPFWQDEIVQSRAAIELCEKELPRNQTCVITAIAKEE